MAEYSSQKLKSAVKYDFKTYKTSEETNRNQNYDDSTYDNSIYETNNSSSSENKNVSTRRSSDSPAKTELQHTNSEKKSYQEMPDYEDTEFIKTLDKEIKDLEKKIDKLNDNDSEKEALENDLLEKKNLKKSFINYFKSVYYEDLKNVDNYKFNTTHYINTVEAQSIVEVYHHIFAGTVKETEVATEREVYTTYDYTDKKYMYDFNEIYADINGAWNQPHEKMHDKDTGEAYNWIPSEGWDMAEQAFSKNFTLMEAILMVKKTDKNIALINDMTLYSNVLDDFDHHDLIDFVSKSDFMTQNEKDNFLYLYRTQGADEASKYADYLEEELNNRKGLYDAEEFLRNLDLESPTAVDHLQTHFKGLEDGIESFFEGIHNAVGGMDGKMSADQYEAMYISYYLSESGYDNLLDDNYSISSSIGNLIPSMVASVVVSLAATPAAGTKVGALLMGVSAGGNAAESAYQQGYSYNESLWYGALNGTSETVLGYYLGKIPGLSKVDDFAKLPGFKGYFSKMLGEGVEESLQAIIDPYLRSYILGEDLNIDWDEVLKQGVYGMVIAGYLNGGQVIFNGKEMSVEEYIKQAQAKGELTDITPEMLEELNNLINNGSSDIKTDTTNVNTNDRTTSGLTIGDGKYIDLYNVFSNVKVNNYKTKLNNNNYKGKELNTSDFELETDNRGINTNYKAEELKVSDFEFETNDRGINTTGNSIPLKDYSNYTKDERGLLFIIENHNKKYGLGDAEYRLSLFVDPNSQYYGDYSLISSANGANTMFRQYSVEEIRHTLKNLFYDGSTTNISGFFRSVGDPKKYTFGVDQGGIDSLYNYYDENGNKYSKYGVKKILEHCQKTGDAMPQIRKVANAEYGKLRKKLVDQGFSQKNASVILESVDDAGACSYAQACNEIFASFIGKEAEFEQKFGYPMYKIENGNKVLNSNELLLDLYVYTNTVANGGAFILNDKSLNPYMLDNRKDFAGRDMLKTKKYQQYLSHGSRNGPWKDSTLYSFLNSKGIRYEAHAIAYSLGYASTYDDVQMQQIVDSAKQAINNGEVLSLDIWDSRGVVGNISLNSTNPNSYNSDSTSRYKGGGHSVFITDIGLDCFYVSSYGREYSIKFKDLQNGWFTIYRVKIN